MVRFVFVRASLTDWSTSGATMDASVIAFRARLEGNEARVLEGLAELKNKQGHKNGKIYDPFLPRSLFAAGGHRIQAAFCS